MQFQWTAVAASQDSMVGWLLREQRLRVAHAHLYQRLTYRYADGWEVPYLVAGSGGHAPVEDLWKPCGDGPDRPARPLPFDAVLPNGLTLPSGDRVQVVAYTDQTSGDAFGFLRLTVTDERLTGEFFAAFPGPLRLADSFTLDLSTHQLV